MNRTVYLLTTGDGSDGDEWDVKSIHATREGAEKAKIEYGKPQPCIGGGTFCPESKIEEWYLED